MHGMIFALLVILVILLVYLFWQGRDERTRKSARVSLSASSGARDAATRAYLAAMLQLTHPTPRDHFETANVLHRYVADEPFVRYQPADGTLFEAHLGGGDTELPILGLITAGYRLALGGGPNLEQVDLHEIEDFADETPIAVQLALRRDIDIVHNERRRRAHIRRQEREAQRARAGGETAAANAPVEGDPRRAGNLAKGDAPGARGALHDPRKAGNLAKDDIFAATDIAVERAADMAPEQTWKSLPQNVHDSSVNKGLRKTLRLLAADNGAQTSPAASIAAAREFVAEHFAGQEAFAASSVLDTVARGDKISTFSSQEDTIFSLVWERTGHPRNRAAAHDLRVMLIQALIDAHNNDSPVCINGRCARYIGSLAVLDFDERAGRALTYDACKNQVYAAAQKVLETELAANPSATDADLARQVRAVMCEYLQRPDMESLNEREKESLLLDCVAAIE